MRIAAEDLERRRPLWEALADLFLDTELQEYHYRFVATRVLESAYTATEVQEILWDEVFPVIEWNLRHPAGVWSGFRVESLQEAILGGGKKETASAQPATAKIVREAWAEVCRYLPEAYRCGG